MDDVENLLKQTVGELDKLMAAKNVVGEPLTSGDVTIIPLVSYGFGFGAGGGTGGPGGQAQGTGGGTGGGGGIKPVAVIIAGPDGVQLQPVKTTGARLMDSLGDAIAKATGKSGGETGD